MISTATPSRRGSAPAILLPVWGSSSTAVAQLDLVITVDTSVAHIVGALGRPVWMLSRFDACWRWGPHCAS